ncbi:hypothetical protein ABVK25_008040 [Lepraria finkii]|uniref:Peroxin-7 n=1 Tax=Lepraria finkii TaxID=1340010 RepID=A0ABR4B153_9LECA
MLEYRTQGFNGYAVKYSPFFDSRIAVATSQHYGIIGNGRLYILGLTPKGIVAEKWFDTQDSLFDLAWSETHENQCLVAAGDGSVKLFDIGLDEFPIQSWKEHNRDVIAVHWNLVAKDTFCSSSWDGTIKVWSPHRPTSLQTLPTHSCTYSTSFSPPLPPPSLRRLLRFSPPHLRPANTLLRLKPPRPHNPPPRRKATPPNPRSLNNFNPNAFDPNTPSGPFPPNEALTHDWNKYRSNVVAVAGVDRLIRTFDLRGPAGPMDILGGHDYAIRRIAWSPHLSDTLLSASYDMTCRVWTDGSAKAVPQAQDGIGQARELGRMGVHTEFVFGVDWCLLGRRGGQLVRGGMRGCVFGMLGSSCSLEGP